MGSQNFKITTRFITKDSSTPVSLKTLYSRMYEDPCLSFSVPLGAFVHPDFNSISSLIDPIPVWSFQFRNLSRLEKKIKKLQSNSWNMRHHLNVNLPYCSSNTNSKAPFFQRTSMIFLPITSWIFYFIGDISQWIHLVKNLVTHHIFFIFWMTADYISLTDSIQGSFSWSVRAFPKFKNCWKPIRYMHDISRHRTCSLRINKRRMNKARWFQTTFPKCPFLTSKWPIISTSVIWAAIVRGKNDDCIIPKTVCFLK